MAAPIAIKQSTIVHCSIGNSAPQHYKSMQYHASLQHLNFLQHFAFPEHHDPPVYHVCCSASNVSSQPSHPSVHREDKCITHKHCMPPSSNQQLAPNDILRRSARGCCSLRAARAEILKLDAVLLCIHHAVFPNSCIQQAKLTFVQLS